MRSSSRKVTHHGDGEVATPKAWIRKLEVLDWIEHSWLTRSVFHGRSYECELLVNGFKHNTSKNIYPSGLTLVQSSPKPCGKGEVKLEVNFLRYILCLGYKKQGGLSTFMVKGK